MREASPNFRLSVRAEGDDYSVPTTLKEFLADNEGAEDVCEQVKKLAPGEGTTLGTIRPARKHTVFELELADFAQRMLEKQAGLNAAAKKKARRSRR